MGGAICSICDSFTALQRDMLAMPQYQIRKDKKAGLLMPPKDVTELDSTSDLTEEEVRLEAPAQPVASTSTGGQEFVSKQDFDKLSSQLDKCFEALLSRKKSALPATGLVDAESNISSDTTIQPVLPSQGTQSTQPTYAEVVETSQNSAATSSTGSTSGFTSSNSNCTGFTSGFTGSSSVASQISSQSALTSTSVYGNDQRVDQTNLT